MTNSANPWKIATFILIALLAVSFYKLWEEPPPQPPRTSQDEIEYPYESFILEGERYSPIAHGSRLYILDNRLGALYLVSRDSLVFIDIPNDRAALERRILYRERPSIDDIMKELPAS